MLFDMLECGNLLKKYQLNFVYNGPLWANIVEGLAQTLKKRMQLDELPMSVSQTIFSVFVEQVNNMLMYSEEKEIFENANGQKTDISSGAFVVGLKDNYYFLQSGNYMAAKNMDLVKERIEYLNSLDSKQLRKYYKEMLRSEDDNEQSKGAGLGLIEIARRASSKIDYSFTKIDENISYFSMYVEVGGR